MDRNHYVPVLWQLHAGEKAAAVWAEPALVAEAIIWYLANRSGSHCNIGGKCIASA